MSLGMNEPCECAEESACAVGRRFDVIIRTSLHIHEWVVSVIMGVKEASR